MKIKLSKFNVYILAIYSILLTFPGWLPAAKNTQNIEHLLQMPVAVSQASKIGIPDHALEEMAGSLNRGQLSPAQFNGFIRQTPEIAENMQSVNRVGAFVTSHVAAGRRGEELASTIRQELRQMGIPAKKFANTAPPLARSGEKFFPGQAKIQIQRAIEAQNRDRQQAPASGGPPAASPGQPGMSQPGMGMPGGGTRP